GNELSLMPSRSSPFDFWVAEVPMDRQAILLMPDIGDDGSSGLRLPITYIVRCA
ncbi:hypothetical protein HAX54_016321, partial [Datura stramonium]|nr:hypothetical protein [Datura stramonium]